MANVEPKAYIRRSYSYFIDLFGCPRIDAAFEIRWGFPMSRLDVPNEANAFWRTGRWGRDKTIKKEPKDQQDEAYCWRVRQQRKIKRQELKIREEKKW